MHVHVIIIIDTYAVWKLPYLFKFLTDSHPLPLSNQCLDILVVQTSPNCLTGFSQYGADSRSAQTKLKDSETYYSGHNIIITVFNQSY